MQTLKPAYPEQMSQLLIAEFGLARATELAEGWAKDPNTPTAQEQPMWDALGYTPEAYWSDVAALLRLETQSDEPTPEA